MKSRQYVLYVGVFVGLLMPIITTIVAKIFSYMSPGLVFDYQNMQLFYLHSFLQGIFFAHIWAIVKDVLKPKELISRGAGFGIAMWGVSTIPYMVLIYAAFPVSGLLVVSWSVAELCALMFAGTTYAQTIK